MAGDEDNRKSTWSSWLAPGDTRHTKGSAQHLDVTDHAKRATQCPEQNEPVPTSNGNADTYETNPFIAFKHFVDGKFAALTNFSSNVAELKRNFQEEEAVYQATTRDHYKRWTGNNGVWDSMFRYPEPQPPLDLAKAAASLLIEESRQRNCYIPALKVMELYGEDEDFDHLREHPNLAVLGTSHAPDYVFVQSLEPNHQILPSASELLSPGWRKSNGRFDETRWLSVEWFKHSPYSPVNLEGDSDLSKYDTKWRNSFEDLLEASLDKPMTSEERSGHRLPGVSFTSTWRGPGIDWMLSLQCRGILPPQLPSLYSCVALKESPARSLPDYLSASQMKSVEDIPARDPASSWQDAGFHTTSQLAHGEYMQLVYEIATPVPRDGVLTASELLASQERELPSFPRDNTAVRDYQHQLMRWEQLFERQRTQRASMEGRCPDELGRAVGDVARTSDSEVHDLNDAQMQRFLEARNQKKAELMHERGASISDWDWEGITPEERQQWREGRTSSEHQRQGGPITELDVYEYMDRHGDSDSQPDSEKPICGMQRNSPPVGKCPDELGRAVGEAARQQAARAFADEENDLRDNEELDDFDIAGFQYTHEEDVTSDTLVADPSWALRHLMDRLKDVDRAPTVAEFQRLRDLLSEWIDSLLYRQEHLQNKNHTLADALQALKQDRAGDEQQSGAGFSLQVAKQADVGRLVAYQNELERLTDPSKISADELGTICLMLQTHFSLLMDELRQAEDENSNLHNILLAIKRERDGSEQDSAPGDYQSVQRAMHAAAQWSTSGERAEHWTQSPPAMNKVDVSEYHRDIVNVLNKLVRAISELNEQTSDENDLLLSVADANMKTLLDENRFIRGTQGAILQELKALRDNREADKAANKTRGSRQLSDRPFGDSLPAQANADKPGVLSTLTTTQTTRMPDGSVKTSVVLKRRFADGREETQESTQTSFDDGVAPSAGGDREAQREKKKGWFWN